MNRAPVPRDYLILFGLSLIWGTSYILIKKGLTVFTPYQVATLRLGISALAFLPFIAHHLKKVKRQQIPLLIIVGLAGTGLPSFLYPAAQTHVSSSVAGILSSLTPLFTFLLAWLAFGMKVIPKQGLGILIGLGGAILLTLSGTSSEGSGIGQLPYMGLIMLATLCYATSSNLVKAHLQDMPAFTITVVSFFLVGLPALIWTFTGANIPAVVSQHPQGWEGLAYVSFLALFSTVLASVIFFKLVQQTSAVFGSTVSYLVPVVALGWGLLDNESIGWPQLLAFGLILTGVFLSRGK
ncbi:MAG: DMT family transporter [Bacteroidota bacterium]